MTRRKKTTAGKGNNSQTAKSNKPSGTSCNKNTDTDTNTQDDKIMRTCLQNDSVNASHTLTPSKLALPLSTTPSPSLNKIINNSDFRYLSDTPKRSRRERQCLQVTNLNTLFASQYERPFDCSGTSSEIINIESDDFLKREKRIASTQCDVIVDLPVVTLVNSNTQTDCQVPESKCTQTPSISITETPKRAPSFMNYFESNCAINLNTGSKVTSEAGTGAKGCINQEIDYYSLKVNCNPYAKNNILDLVGKERVQNRTESEGELSFFTPQLFDIKSSSTPIEKKPISNENDVHDKNSGSHVTFMERNILCTEKEVSFKMLKSDHIRLSKTLAPAPAPAPRARKYISRGKLLARSHSFASHRIYQQRAIPYRRISIDDPEHFSDSNIGTCEKIYNRIRRFSQMSVKWSKRIIEMCSQLGVTLKKFYLQSLTTICQMYALNSSMLAGNCVNDLSPCKCSEYRNKIDSLDLRIRLLTNELNDMRLLIDQQRSDLERNAALNDDLAKIKEELTQFKEFRQEFNTLKEQVKYLTDRSITNQPKAPPLPPPPPPLPPPPTIPATLTAGRKSKTLSRRSDRKEEDTRPMISLEDILKVKLKKASERPPQRRLSQPPSVSMELLRSVKLRPASRPKTECSSECSSPSTSLTRLLLTDGTPWRVKRLKRVSGYSFDDFSRRNQLARRDRELIAD